MQLAHYLPSLIWLRAYDRLHFGNDLLAAVVVTLMLIPQSLAYAMLAGLPPAVGLYASMLPLVAYAVFGSSRTLSVGPVAVVSLMTASAVGQVAQPGTAGYVESALILAALSGAMLTVAGLLRLGFLSSLLSHPVVTGFIMGSALLIAASQLKHLLGIAAKGDNLPTLLPSLASHLQDINLPTLAVGGSAVAFLFWVRRALGKGLQRLGVGPRLSEALVKAGPVVAVLAGIGAVQAFALGSEGVRTVGAIPAGLPGLTWPAFDTARWTALLPAAGLISIIGFVESVSVSQSLGAKRGQRVDPDQELVGLGAANLAAACTGGYPVTGGFARSVVNFAAGAQTQMAGVLTAAFIALATLFLTPLFRDLPVAVLAATIVVAVLGLVDFPGFLHTWQYSRADFIASAATLLLVLLHSVESGLMAGVGLSLFLHFWRTTRPQVVVVGRVAGTEDYRNVARHEVITSSLVLAVRVDESLYFANIRFLEDRIASELALRPSVRHVVLIASAVNVIDASALESLERFTMRLRSDGVTLHLAQVKGPVLDKLHRVGFAQHLNPGRIFASPQEAMAALDPGTCKEASCIWASP